MASDMYPLQEDIKKHEHNSEAARYKKSKPSEF
jgi:hypothetical protein